MQPKFADILRTVRLYNGFTQENVAKAVNIERSTYTYYESGKTMPTCATLLKLARLFGVTVEQLLGAYPIFTEEGRREEGPRRHLLLPDQVYLKKEEKNFLAQFRMASPKTQQQVLELLKNASSG